MEEAENPDDGPIPKIDEPPAAPSQSCALCGCSTPAVRCDRCSSQIFCLSCDDMYHRHPKRRLHLRKAIDSIWSSAKSPRLRRRTELPGDPSKIPIPPPRSKKRAVGGGRLFLKHELGSFGHSKMFDLRTIAPPPKNVFAGQKTSHNLEGTYENETHMATNVVGNTATGNDIYENENIPMNTRENVDNSNSMGQVPWNVPRTNISSPIQVSIPSSSPDMITNGQSFGYPMKPQSRSIADLTGAPPHPIGTHPYHLPPHYPYMHPPMHPYSHSMAHLNCAQCVSSSWSNLMSPHPSPYFHPMPWGSANASLARGHPVPGANGHGKHGSMPSFADPNFHFPYPGGAFYANGAPVMDPNFAGLQHEAVEQSQKVKRSRSGSRSRQTLSPENAENAENMEVTTDSALEVKTDESPAPKEIKRKKPEIDDEPPKIPKPPSQPWSCLHCTYVNPPGIHICEICCKTSYGNESQSENQNEGRSFDSRNSDSPMELVNLDALSQSPDFIKQRVQKDEGSIGADSLETEEILDSKDQEPQTPEPSTMLTTETQTFTTTKTTDAQTQNLIFQSIETSTDSIFPRQEISVQTDTETTTKNCSVATDPMISSQSMESLMSGFSAPPYQNRRAGWGRGASFSTQSLYERGRSRSPIPRSISEAQSFIPRSLSEAQSFVRDSSLPPEEAMHSWSQAWLMSDPMYYKPHNLPGYGQTGKEDYYDGTWGSMDKLNKRVQSKQGKKSEVCPRPKLHRSLDDLKAEKTQDVIHSRELQFLQTVKEAERCGFSLEDLHVAYLHCGKENPVFWLEDNWSFMIKNVVALAAKYGEDNEENDVGVITASEAKQALHIHRGDIWDAVTECIENRQRKILELTVRGNFTQKQIADALKNNDGNVELAYADLLRASTRRHKFILSPGLSEDSEYNPVDETAGDHNVSIKAGKLDVQTDYKADKKKSDFLTKLSAIRQAQSERRKAREEKEMIRETTTQDVEGTLETRVESPQSENIILSRTEETSHQEPIGEEPFGDIEKELADAKLEFDVPVKDSDKKDNEDNIPEDYDTNWVESQGEWIEEYSDEQWDEEGDGQWVSLQKKYQSMEKEFEEEAKQMAALWEKEELEDDVFEEEPKEALPESSEAEKIKQEQDAKFQQWVKVNLEKSLSEPEENELSDQPLKINLSKEPSLSRSVEFDEGLMCKSPLQHYPTEFDLSLKTEPDWVDLEDLDVAEKEKMEAKLEEREQNALEVENLKQSYDVDNSDEEWEKIDLEIEMLDDMEKGTDAPILESQKESLSQVSVDQKDIQTQSLKEGNLEEFKDDDRITDSNVVSPVRISEETSELKADKSPEVAIPKPPVRRRSKLNTAAIEEVLKNYESSAEVPQLPPDVPPALPLKKKDRSPENTLKDLYAVPDKHKAKTEVKSQTEIVSTKKEKVDYQEAQAPLKPPRVNLSPSLDVEAETGEKKSLNAGFSKDASPVTSLSNESDCFADSESDPEIKIIRQKYMHRKAAKYENEEDDIFDDAELTSKLEEPESPSALRKEVELQSKPFEFDPELQIPVGTRGSRVVEIDEVESPKAFREGIARPLQLFKVTKQSSTEMTPEPTLTEQNKDIDTMVSGIVKAYQEHVTEMPDHSMLACESLASESQMRDNQTEFSIPEQQIIQQNVVDPNYYNTSAFEQPLNLNNIQGIEITPQVASKVPLEISNSSIPIEHIPEEHLPISYDSQPQNEEEEIDDEAKVTSAAADYYFGRYNEVTVTKPKKRATVVKGSKTPTPSASKAMSTSEITVPPVSQPSVMEKSASPIMLPSSTPNVAETVTTVQPQKAPRSPKGDPKAVSATESPQEPEYLSFAEDYFFGSYNEVVIPKKGKKKIPPKPIPKAPEKVKVGEAIPAITSVSQAEMVSTETNQTITSSYTTSPVTSALQHAESTTSLYFDTSSLMEDTFYLAETEEQSPDNVSLTNNDKRVKSVHFEDPQPAVLPPPRKNRPKLMESNRSSVSSYTSAADEFMFEQYSKSSQLSAVDKKKLHPCSEDFKLNQESDPSNFPCESFLQPSDHPESAISSEISVCTSKEPANIIETQITGLFDKNTRHELSDEFVSRELSGSDKVQDFLDRQLTLSYDAAVASDSVSGAKMFDEDSSENKKHCENLQTFELSEEDTSIMVEKISKNGMKNIETASTEQKITAEIQSSSKITPSFDTHIYKEANVVANLEISEATASTSENASINICSKDLLKSDLKESGEGNSDFKMASDNISDYATDVTEKDISGGHSPVSEDILISDSYTVKLESSSMTNRILDEEANSETERDTYSVHIDEDFEDGLLLVEEAENLINEFCDIYPPGIFDIASSNEIQNLNTKNNKQESTYDSEHEWKLNEQRYNTLNANFIENKLYKSKGSPDPHISDDKESLIIDIKSSAEGSEISDISLEASTSDLVGISDIAELVFASSEDLNAVSNRSDIYSAEAPISDGETEPCIVSETTSKSVHVNIVQPLSILCQEAASTMDFEPSCSKSLTLECTEGSEDERIYSESEYSKSEFLDVSIDVSDESLVTSTRSSISTQIPVPSDVQIQDLVDELDYEMESKTPVQTAVEECDETLNIPSDTDYLDQANIDLASDKISSDLDASLTTDLETNYTSAISAEIPVRDEQIHDLGDELDYEIESKTPVQTAVEECDETWNVPSSSDYVDQTNLELASDKVSSALDASSITDYETNYTPTVDYDTSVILDKDDRPPVTTNNDPLTKCLDTDGTIDSVDDASLTHLDANISLTKDDDTTVSLPEPKENILMTKEEDLSVEYGVMSDVYNSASQNQAEVSVNREEQAEIQHTLAVLPDSSEMAENEIKVIDSCKDESPERTDQELVENSEDSCVSLMSHFYDEWFENVKTSEKSSILLQDVRSKYATYYNYAESSNSGSASDNEEFPHTDTIAVSNIVSTQVELSIEESRTLTVDDSVEDKLEQYKDQEVDTCDSSIETKPYDELSQQTILMNKPEDEFKDTMYEKDIKISNELSVITSEELEILESNRQIIESVGLEEKIFTTTKSCQTDDSFEEDQFFDSFDDPLMDPSFLYLPIDKKVNIEPVKVEIGIQCHLITSEVVVPSDKTLEATKSEIKTYKSEEIQVGKGTVNIDDPIELNDVEKVIVTDVITFAKDDSSFEISEDSDSDLFLEPHSSHDELDADGRNSKSKSSFLCAEIDSGFSSGSDCGKRTYKQVTNIEDLAGASSTTGEISFTLVDISEQKVEMTDPTIKQKTEFRTEAIKEATVHEPPKEESIKIKKMALLKSSEQSCEKTEEISSTSTSQTITIRKDSIDTKVSESDTSNVLVEEDIFERAVTPIAIEKVPSIDDLTFIELQTDITEQVVHSETIVYSESCSTPTVEYFYGPLPSSVMSEIPTEGNDYFVEALDLLDACASEITKNHVENALASLAYDHSSPESDTYIDSEELSESLSSFHELDDDSLTESASEYFLLSDDDDKASLKDQLQEDLNTISSIKTKEVKSNIQNSSLIISKKSNEEAFDKKLDETTESLSVEPDSLNENDKTCDASEFEDSLYLESTSEYSLPLDSLPKHSEKISKSLPIIGEVTNILPEVVFNNNLSTSNESFQQNDVVKVINQVETLVQDIDSEVSSRVNEVQIEEKILQPHSPVLMKSLYSESVPEGFPSETPQNKTVPDKSDSEFSSLHSVSDVQALPTQTTCSSPADSSELYQTTNKSVSSEINIQKSPEINQDQLETLKTSSSDIKSSVSSSAVDKSLYLESIPDYFTSEVISTKTERVESPLESQNVFEKTCEENLTDILQLDTTNNSLTADKKSVSDFTLEAEFISTSTSEVIEEELKIASYKSDIPPVPSDIVRYLYYGDDITFEEASSVHDDTSFNSAHNTEPISDSGVIHSDNSFQSLDSELKAPKKEADNKDNLLVEQLTSKEVPELISQDLQVSVDEQSAEYQSIQTFSSDPECFESAYLEQESTDQWYELDASRSLPVHNAVVESIPNSEFFTETNSLTKEDGELPCIPELILEQGTKDDFPVAKVDSDEVTDISTHFTMTEDDSDKFSDIESDSSLQDFEADSSFPHDIQSKNGDAINEIVIDEVDHIVVSDDRQESSQYRMKESSSHENSSHSEVFLDPNANENVVISAGVCDLKENLEGDEVVEDIASPIRDVNGNVTESPVSTPTLDMPEIMPLTIEKVSNEPEQQFSTTQSKEVEKLKISSSSSFIQTPEDEFYDLSQITESCYTSPILESEYWLDANTESMLETEDSEFILPNEDAVGVTPIISSVIFSKEESSEVVSKVEVQNVIKQDNEATNFPSTSNIENLTEHVICSTPQEVVSNTEAFVVHDLLTNDLPKKEEAKIVLDDSKESFVTDSFNLRDYSIKEIEPISADDKGAIIELEVKSSNEILMSDAVGQVVIPEEASRKLYETKDSKFEDHPRDSDALPSVVSDVIETECKLNFGNKEEIRVSLEGKVCHVVPEDSSFQIEPEYSSERVSTSPDFISPDADDKSSESKDAKIIDLDHQEETFSFSKFGYLFKDGILADSSDRISETNPDSPLNVDLSVRYTEDLPASNLSSISGIDKVDTFLVTDSELLEQSEQNIVTMGQISTVLYPKTDDKQHIKDKEYSYFSVGPDDFDSLKKDSISDIQPQEVLITDTNIAKTQTSHAQEVVETLCDTKENVDSSSISKTVPDEVTQDQLSETIQGLGLDKTSPILDVQAEIKESLNKEEVTDASFGTLTDELDSWHEEDSEALIEDFPIDKDDKNLSLNQDLIHTSREIVSDIVEDTNLEAKFVISDEKKKVKDGIENIVSNIGLVPTTTIESSDISIQKEPSSKIESFSYSETDTANFYSACDDLDNTSVITSDEDFTDVPSHFTLTEGSEAWSDIETDSSIAFDDCEDHSSSAAREKTPTRDDGGYTFREDDFYSFKGNLVDEAIAECQIESEVTIKCSEFEDKAEISESAIKVPESECPLPQFACSDSLPEVDTINKALISGDDNTVALKGLNQEINVCNIETSSAYSKDGPCSDVLEESIKLDKFENVVKEQVLSSQDNTDTNINNFNVVPVKALKKDNSEGLSDPGNEVSEPSSYSMFETVSKDDESENFSDIESEIYGDFEDSVSKADEQQHSETFDFVPFAEESGKSTIKRNKSSKTIVDKIDSKDKKDVELRSSSNIMEKDSNKAESTESSTGKPTEQVSITDGKKTLSLSIADIVEASELQHKTDETTETLLLEQFADIKSLSEPLALAEIFSTFEPDTAILKIHEDIGDVSLHLEMTEDSDYWLEAETEYSISEFEDEAASLSLKDTTDPYFMDVNNVSDRHLYATSSQHSDATAAGISTTFYTDTDYSDLISDTCADISLQGGTTDNSDKWSDIEGDAAIDEALYGLAHTSEVNKKDLSTTPGFSLLEDQGNTKSSEVEIDYDQLYHWPSTGKIEKQELSKITDISKKISSEISSIQVSLTSEKSSDSVSESYTQPLSDPLACNISASGLSDEDFTSITPLDGTVDELDKFSDISNDSSVEEIQHDSKSTSKSSPMSPKDVSGEEVSAHISKEAVDENECELSIENKPQVDVALSDSMTINKIKTLEEDVQTSGSTVSSLKDVVTENVVYEELVLDTIEEDVSEADTSGVGYKEDAKEILKPEAGVVNETGIEDRLNLSTSPPYENEDYENYEDNFEGDEYLEGEEYDPNIDEHEMEFGEEDYPDESVPYIENEDELVYPLQTEDWIGESFDLKEYGIDYAMSGSETDVHGYGVNDEYEDMQRAIDFNISNFDEAIDNLVDDQNLATESFKTISNNTPTQSKMTDKEHESWSTADADSIDDDLSEHDNLISKIDELLAEDFAYDHTDYYRDDVSVDVVDKEEMQGISPIEEPFETEDTKVADFKVIESSTLAHKAEENVEIFAEAVKSDVQKISEISSKPPFDSVIDNSLVNKHFDECAMSKETAIGQLESVAVKERSQVTLKTESDSFKVQKSSEAASDIVSSVESSNFTISSEQSGPLTVKGLDQVEPKHISVAESKDKMSSDQSKTFTVKKPSVKESIIQESVAVKEQSQVVLETESNSFKVKIFSEPASDIVSSVESSNYTISSEQSEPLTVKEPNQSEPKPISVAESKDKMSSDQSKTFTVKKPSKCVLETVSASDSATISEQSEAYIVKKLHASPETVSVVSSASKILSEQSESFTVKKPSKDVSGTISATISEQSEGYTVKKLHATSPKNASVVISASKISSEQSESFTVKKPSPVVSETIPVVDSNVKVLTKSQEIEKSSCSVSENVSISDSHPKTEHDEKKDLPILDLSSESTKSQFKGSESTKSERFSKEDTVINQSLNISAKEHALHSETETATTKTVTTDTITKVDKVLIKDETTKLDSKNETQIVELVKDSATPIDKPLIKKEISETESNIPSESKEQIEKQLPSKTSETVSSAEQTDTTVRRRRVRRTSSQNTEEESADPKPDIPVKRRRDSALREARKASISSPDDEPRDRKSSSSETSDENQSKPDIPEKRKRKPALPKAEPESKASEAPALPPKTIKRDSSSDSISSSVFLSSSSESLSCYESASLKDSSNIETFAEPEVPTVPDVPARKAPVRQRRRESSEDTSSSITRSSSSRCSYDLPPKESMDLCRKRTSIDERMVKLQAAGKCSTKESAFIAAKLIEMQFDEEDALLASRQCSSIYHAVKFLTQLCELCQCRFPINSMASMIHCAHRACKECLKAHFTNQIYDRSVFTLLCPICHKPDITDQNIQEYFNHLEIMFRNILDTHVYDLFQRKLRDEVLTKDPNFHWCSQCSSGFIASPRLKKLYCPDCSAITCASCHQTWELEHEGVHCERFQQWKDMFTPEPPPAGLVKLLTDRGITCPSCDLNYEQACAGCMMYKCSHCSFEFCGFCSQPVKRGKECGNKQCEPRGAHAHHPYTCLFFLRDKDVSELQLLLDEESVKYLTIPPKDQIVKSRCQVREQKHIHGSITEDRCGRDIVPYCAGLCRPHYYEYLAELMRKNKINPLSLMTTQDLQFMLRKSRCPVPEKVKGESNDDFYDRLTETVSSTLS